MLPSDYGIVALPNGYQVIELGIRLPMVFATLEGAKAQIEMLKLFPLSRAEIRDVLREHAQEAK